MVCGCRRDPDRSRCADGHSHPSFSSPREPSGAGAARAGVVLVGLLPPAAPKYLETVKLEPVCARRRVGDADRSPRFARGRAGQGHNPDCLRCAPHGVKGSCQFDEEGQMVTWDEAVQRDARPVLSRRDEFELFVARSTTART